MAEVDYDKLTEPTEGEVEAEVAEEESQEEVQEEPKEEPKEESRSNERIRQLVDEKNELKTRVESLEKLQEEIVKLRDTMKEPEPVEPEVDFMEDPKEYVDHNRRALEQRINALESQDQESGQQTQQEIFALKLQMSISDSEREFTSEHPDYMAALKYNRETRAEELEMMGVTGDDAKQVIGQEEVFLARRKLDTGESPAEAAYKLALKRGYKPQVVDPETVDEELDKEVESRQKARDAQSMGGSGVSSPAEVDDTPQQEAWNPLIDAAIEAYGEKAAREMFGDLMK